MSLGDKRIQGCLSSLKCTGGWVGRCEHINLEEDNGNIERRGLSITVVVKDMEIKPCVEKET